MMNHQDHPSSNNMTATPLPSKRTKPSSSSSNNNDHTISPSANASLYGLLQRDIGPNGRYDLLPFLTTGDRLRLSECSRNLTKYRGYLSRIIIGTHPSPTLANKRGLVQLLLDQQPGAVEYLSFSDLSLVNVLELATWGCFEGLKTLDLNLDGRYGLEKDEAISVGRALSGGGLQNLEELILSFHEDIGDGLRPILAALKDGACPRLRRLTINDHGELYGIGKDLSEALQSGHLSDLQELRMKYTKMGYKGGEAVARALQEGACPRLVKVSLESCSLNESDGWAWGIAIASGALANVEELNILQNYDLGDEGMVAIYEALEGGHCPRLKRLDCCPFSMGIIAGRALGRMLSSGQWHHLQELNICETFQDPLASLRMFEGLQQGGPFENLSSLNVGSTKMGDEHGRLLGEAIRDGAFPRLEQLDVGYNDELGDGVVHCLVALGDGGCPRLKSLNIPFIAMGPLGGQALAQALASGHLACLEELDFASNDKIKEDSTMAAIITSLRCCRRIRSLFLHNYHLAEQSGQALLQTLTEGSPWLNLSSLAVSENPELGDDIVGGGLAEILEKGGFPKLRSMGVYNCGMSSDGIGPLLAAIEKGVCPLLQHISVDKWVGKSWDERLKRKGVKVCR